MAGLSKEHFHILVSLADRDQHGYGILLDIAERTGGKLRLSPSTLYGNMKKLLSDGFIEELEERPDPSNHDERRRYYRLATSGRIQAIAEARRLEKLLADAKASGLLPKGS